jgi:hypothetical protein
MVPATERKGLMKQLVTFSAGEWRNAIRSRSHSRSEFGVEGRGCINVINHLQFTIDHLGVNDVNASILHFQFSTINLLLRMQRRA